MAPRHFIPNKAIVCEWLREIEGGQTRKFGLHCQGPGLPLKDVFQDLYPLEALLEGKVG